MVESLLIGGDGTFEVNGKSYRIPAQFSTREVFSYKRLLEPIPDSPGGTSLTTEQRSRQRAYFFRRAAACVIPGLEPKTLECLSLGSLVSLHRWIVSHRPELSLDGYLAN
jgi:hypothetical protein